MDWTDDAIAQLKKLWAEGLSTAKIGAIMGEMLRDWDMMKRRLREGQEFFRFLKERKQIAQAA